MRPTIKHTALSGCTWEGRFDIEIVRDEEGWVTYENCAAAMIIVDDIRDWLREQYGEPWTRGEWLEPTHRWTNSGTTFFVRSMADAVNFRLRWC